MNNQLKTAQEKVDIPTLSKIHRLKIFEKWFDQAKKGIKPYELRFNDRDYSVGDTVIMTPRYEAQDRMLNECNKMNDSVESITGIITNVVNFYDVTGLEYGYCILSIDYQ